MRGQDWVRGMLGSVLLFAWAVQPAQAARDEVLTVASTTDMQNSGLYDWLLPKFKAASGIEVHVVAVGTGAALDLGKRCDADAVLVHAKAQELAYVAAGYGIERHDLMYNDFVIVGPAADPAHIEGMHSAVAALAKIHHDQVPFLSRGDNSGTNIKELALWKDAGLDPAPASGTWYRETGTGMGPTLNTARAMDGYTLTDRATWISFRNKGDLKVLVQGDPELLNQYGVMLVSPKRCPHARIDLARSFRNWLISGPGQQAIASFRLQGQQLYHPNADR